MILLLLLHLFLFRILPTGFARIIFLYLTRVGCDEGKSLSMVMQPSDVRFLAFGNGNLT
jgi:hypothetical protein